MIEEILEKLNLSSKEATIYTFLLQNGPSLAPKIVEGTGINRTNSYALLESLIKKGLVMEKKETHKRKTVYSVTNPTTLYEILESKEEELFFLKKNFNQAYQSIKTLYETSSEKPIVRILSGLKGVKILYDMMLNSKSEILIFVSRHDRDDQEHEKMIEENIIARGKKKISVRALNPHQKKFPLSGLPAYIEKRAKEYTTVRLIPSEFVFPSQIIVFENYIGITSLKKDLTTTIIENTNIAGTMRMIFNFMWDATLPFHTNLLKNATLAKVENED